MNKIIVGVIAPPYNATAFYRCYIPFNYLKKYNQSVEIKYLKELTWSEMSDIDILFMMRAENEEAYKAITYAKLMGIKVWLDMDDDLLSVPKDNPNFEHYSKIDTMRSISLCLAEADLITFSTEFLLNKYRDGLNKISKYPPRCALIKNASNPKLFRFSEHKNRNRIIAWRGSNTHSGDIKTIASECEQFDHEWHFIGYKPKEFGIRLHTTYQESMDTVVYMNYLTDIRPKIMIVPLENCDFNKAKSNIAWIEATHAGAVTIAPDLPEFKMDGIVNYSDPKQFKETLSYVLNMSEDERSHCVDTSRKHILENLTVFSENEKRLGLIQDLINDK